MVETRAAPMLMPGGGDRLRDLREQARASRCERTRILTLRDELARRRRQSHLDAALGIQLEDLRAVLLVHGHAAPARHEADHFVAGQRRAAAGETHQHVGLPAHAQRAATRRGRGRKKRAAARRLGSGSAAASPLQRAHQLAGREPAVADGGQQVVDRAARRGAAPARPAPSLLERARQREARSAELALEQLAPQLAARAPSPRRGSRGGCWLRALPVTTKSSQSLRGRWRGAWSRSRRCRRPRAGGAAAPACRSPWRPAQCVADLAVDRVGEVDRRGPDRQADHVALRREHEDLVGEQVDLHRSR